MAKSRRSSQRKSRGFGSDAAALLTPARKVTVQDLVATPQGDGGADDTWNFDAPTFYDFANSKTPGPAADEWFNQAHPTPAPRRPRVSQLSTSPSLSADEEDVLLPNRLSLSPSRVVVGTDGRLTIDTVTSDHDTAQDVQFSDTDEEIEFNNWKSAHALASKDSGAGQDEEEEDVRPPAKLSKVRRSSGATEDPAEGLDHSARVSNISTLSASTEATNTSAASSNMRSSFRGSATRIAAGLGGGRVAKASAKAARGTAALAGSLTVPVDLGYMRPTRGAVQRQQARKRDKATRQMIADAISSTVRHRQQSQENDAGLTVPMPFHFAESRSRRGDAPAAAADSVTEKKGLKLSQEAQDHLFAKLAAKRKAVEESTAEQATTPPKKPAKRQGPTIPVTPQFAKSKRTRREPAEANSIAAKEALKPVKRQTKVPAAPAHQSAPKPTVPQPFKFRSDAAAERHLAKLREEIARLHEEEDALRQFHARPLPAFPTPKKKKTQPSSLDIAPFSLSTDARGEAYQQKLHARLDELEQRRRDRMRFKARPIPLSLDQPFVPQASAFPLTEIEEILLRTELRSEERQAYDEDRMERERIRAEVLARKRQEEERREEEEIKRLRKILVHKAQPVRHYKPVVIKPSSRPPTVPKTPRWHVRTRKLSESPAQ